MEIRYINKDEAADFQKVSAASFIWKFDAEVGSTVDMPVLAAFDEGRLIAGVEAYNYKTNYCGNILNSLVISGVCSLPECRRMGGVRKIFEKVEELAVENDWSFGFLHPFSIEYYEKFGFANLNRMFTITVPFEKLRHIPFNTDVTLYKGENSEELYALHKKCAFTENLISLRDERQHFWEKPFEEAKYTYIHRNANGEADGYVGFEVNRPDNLKVTDLFFLSPDALKGLIGFLRGYDGIVKNLIVRNQYTGSPLACLLGNVDNVVFDSDGGLAARIYNMQKVLESNSYPDAYGKFSLKCVDTMEQNNAVFEVEYQNGKATVTKKADGDYDISLTAPAAARLILAGEGITAETAAYLDGVEINGNADDFFRAFPYRRTRFMSSPWSD